jgi:rRNA processing protein Krr1/Pno1
MVDVNFDINYDSKTLKATCPEKLTTPIHVRKSLDGFIFFEVHVEKGKVPGELSGKYTSLDSAKKAIQVYLNGITPSKTVRREAFGKDYEERKKRNATESNTKGS